MSDQSKKIMKKVLWIFITFLLLEALLIAGLTVINVFLEVKLNISIDIIMESLIQTFTKLPTIIEKYISERNPFFILGSLAVIVYSFLIHKNSFKKKGWNTETENAYHGSAHWANESEVFDTKNFKKINKKQVQSDFSKSLKGGNKQ